MEEQERMDAARAMRRAVLGEASVDSQGASPDPVAAEFQDFITSTAWGTWVRVGALSPRDRSLLVLAMTAAIGRMEEFGLHARSSHRAGVTDGEVDELLFQIAAYCGAPAGVAARRAVVAARAAREAGASSDKFPAHVLTGRYGSGFSNLLMTKDLQLYLQAVEEPGGPRSVGLVTAAIWEQFGQAEPGVDFTRIFPFVAGS
jgi:4-carboxymuconolactone decarboxylase